MLAEELSNVDRYNLAYIAIIGSVLASVVSLIALFVNQLANRQNQAELQRHQRELEELKTTLQEQKSEKDARRDYEYEARKRLYQQCEPLLFQLIEHAESGRKRIRSLARTAREGGLSSHDGWLDDPRNYYFESTIYKLLAPLVVFRIIQQKLTLVDLTVDPHINSLYLLSKRLFLSFTDDFKFARIEPQIDYDPNAEVSTAVEERQPEKYKRQALFIGSLETVVDKMIVAENGIQRCMNYGEFAEVYCTKNSISKTFTDVAEIFIDFHPQTRPVLWRLLIAQFHIYNALIHARELKMSNSKIQYKKLLKTLSDKQIKALDWRSGEDVNVSDEKVLVEPFRIAEIYLEENLKDLFSSKTSKGDSDN